MPGAGGRGPGLPGDRFQRGEMRGLATVEANAFDAAHCPLPNRKNGISTAP